ncbi:hypothetical protein NTGBS_350029 [Candidatus Nitrotoga sp. BS]|nr:hypothetical protein NTGBS_350029 [Candidatus Nitrotoga sp. BS]
MHSELELVLFKVLSIDRIKFDKSFERNIAHPKKRGEIEFSHSLGIRGTTRQLNSMSSK